MSVKTERNERDMKLCMGCMNEIEDHLSTCPYCGFNETALRQDFHLNFLLFWELLLSFFSQISLAKQIF